MAAATHAVSTVTPHSFILNIALDGTGSGVAIPMATLQGYASAGPLKNLLAQYSDANCAALNHALNSAGTPGAKKLRIYNVAGPINGTADVYPAANASPRVIFVNGSGLVVTGMVPGIATLYSAWGAVYEFRFIKSEAR